MEEKGKKIKEETKKEENQKRKYLIILILFLLLISIIGISITYGKDIYESIENQIIETLKLNKPTSPEIEGGNKEWKKESLIKVVKDAYTKNGLDYYEYCINSKESTKACNWEKTETKNVKISVTGKYYVTFRAVDKKGNKGNNSNTEIVYIDNQNPVITSLKEKEITKNYIQIEVSAKDEHSGIEGYYYSIDGNSYEKGKTSYTYSNLEANKEYTIYVKVIDKAGNITILSMKVKTKEESNEIVEPSPIPTPTDIPSPTNTPVPPDDENKDPDSSLEPTPTPIPTQTPSPTPTQEPEEEKEIPEINLDKVPSSFIYGEKYDLPSYVSFGSDTGVYSCIVEGKEYKDTSTLKIGKHLIVCTATSSKNIRVMVEKEVEVKVGEGKEEIWDGWIRLNLYYPDNSTDWEYRIGKEGEIRDGYDNTGWEEYTGPILVKLEDVESVYIRYKILGETYIIAPKGKIGIDIEPEKYTVKKEEKTKVKIYYDRDAEEKEYRIGTSNWQEYSGEIEVVANTIIEARATKKEKVYNSEGEYVYTKTITGTDSVFISEYIEKGSSAGSGTTTGGNTGSINYGPTTRSDGTETTKPNIGSKPSTYLIGPNISSTPKAEIVESVKIKVTPQEVAEKIYIRIGNGSYQEYTNEVEVDENTVVSAYYVRRSDGKVSDTSYYYIQNIRVGKKPYVRIDASPNDYLSVGQNQVEVRISGSNYDSLKYSYDGVIYYDYVEALIVEESKTIYAKGTNEEGETVEKLTVTTKTPPKEEKEIAILITTSPREEEVKGLVNKTKVSITYDSKAINKYYKIGEGEWKEYTGEFEVTSNTTIYAYATGENAKGEASKQINFLTTGISNPKIKANTTSKAQQVKIEIEYDSNAEIKRYQIGNGPLLDYNGSFYVYENTVVKAYNKNSLGYEAESTYEINNIVGLPDYLVIEKGKYFIIKLNYPTQVTTKEYKWKKDSEWKEYDEQGILLIKPEYKEEFDLTGKDGIQVEDEKGNKVIFKDHYYLIDVPFSELMENLFMRWDSVKPNSPNIIVEPTTPTKEVEVIINYDKALVNKYYKVVEEDGTDTGWLEYNGGFTVNKNNSVIYAKGETKSEIESEVSGKRIENIDLIEPEIEIKGNLETPKRKVTLTVKVTDNMMVDTVIWSKGEQDTNYFKKNGTVIKSNGIITIEENGKYTVYAKDKAGNETIKVIEVNNIDKESPDIIINVLTEEYGLEAKVRIDYGDSKKKEYKIGLNGSYQEYSSELVISSYDVYKIANSDGSITIYARGTDEAGNVKEVSEDIYILDLDMPAQPIIHSTAGYPILTEYGVKLGQDNYIEYDKRDDITNYYSVDNGKTWEIYMGTFEVKSGTIMAKSVKNDTGLTVTSSKSVSMPSDALGLEAYDKDENSYVDIGYQKNNIVYISKEMIGKSLSIKILRNTGLYDYVYLYFYDSNNKVISSVKWARDYTSYKNIIVNIPANSYKMDVYNGSTYSDGVRVADLVPASAPNIYQQKKYPTLTEYGVTPGYDLVTINYFSTSVEKLYRINGGDWKSYQNQPIRLEIGQKIEAKGIDKFGNETKISSYTPVLPSDALGAKAYDKDENSYVDIGHQKNNIVYISKEMIGKSLSIKILRNTGLDDYVYLYFYDSNNKVISSIKWARDFESYKKLTINIPANSYKMNIYNSSTYSDGVRVANLQTITTPVINNKKYYPILTEYGVTSGYNEVTINYFQTSVDRLYRIDGGNWQKYQNDTIRLEINQKIEAKGIDKFGNETAVISYTSVLPSDALDSAAYDNNNNTYIQKTTDGADLYHYINISKELIGNSIIITGSHNLYLDIYAYFYDNNGNIISKKIILPRGSSSLAKTKMVIPSGTVKFGINYKTAGGYYNQYTRINELSLSTDPVLISEKKYPVLTENGATLGYNFVTIKYLPYLKEKVYSLDNGATWNEYKEPFKVNDGVKILAKAVDTDNKETNVVSYTVSTSSDNMDKEAFDNNKETVVTIPANSSKIFTVSNELINKDIRFFLSDNISASANIKLYDIDNNELETITIINSITVFRLPEKCYKIVVNSGSSALTVKEINVREVSLDDTTNNNPIIEIDDASWTTTKTVIITYPEGYKNEYSLDLGESWIEYLSPITVDNEIVVLARVVDNDKIIASSSFKITKVDNEEPTISVEIPDTIVEKTEYNLPTSYTVGKSGGSASCKIGDDIVTTTKDLEVGEYEIICTVESTTGKISTVSKNFTVIETAEKTFDYTGSEQTFIVPVTGKYKLETWGAQGATDSNSFHGGYGAYASGYINLNQGEYLYVYVGEKGKNLPTSTVGEARSYPNGGLLSLKKSDTNNINFSSGGASTHISLESGLISELGASSDKLLIVASGGGGSCSWWKYGDNGGSGGGIIGSTTTINFPNNGITNNPTGGTQTSGGLGGGNLDGYSPSQLLIGTFGVGGGATSLGISSGSGGGGYYGGGASWGGSGAGGSSYIANPLLTDKAMYCYNCQESTEEQTKTISTTCTSATPTTNCSKQGNGYAKITYIGE